MASPRTLPITAGAILVDGVIRRHTAVRGDVAPDLHPLVRRFLHDLPTHQRERFAGWCAETVLISDRLYEAERAGSGALSAAHARAALWGAQINVVWVREQGDPAHGTPYRPCRSCTALLEWCGVEAILDGMAPGYPAPTAPAGMDLARRWALALASYAAPDGRHHEVVPAAVDAFTRYGGLSAQPDGPGEQVAPSGFLLDPMRALHTVSTLAAFADALRVKVTPLGVEDDGSGLLVIDEEGRVFVLDPTAEWFLGDTIGRALENLVSGRAPARVRQDGAWS
ncbi:MAG TPA: SUKH-3 domain-containing protein [Micromonosporaceae bacterium]|nr:SUKH-3 domain-containing protein [Micromonosporaceae bacterium]